MATAWEAGSCSALPAVPLRRAARARASASAAAARRRSLMLAGSCTDRNQWLAADGQAPSQPGNTCGGWRETQFMERLAILSPGEVCGMRRDLERGSRNISWSGAAATDPAGPRPPPAPDASTSSSGGHLKPCQRLSHSEWGQAGAQAPDLSAPQPRSTRWRLYSRARCQPLPPT